MARRRRSKGRSKWAIDFTGAKLNLICFKRWGFLSGAGRMMQGQYEAGLEKMGEGGITGVITDAVTASLGYRVKTMLAPKGVPLFKSRNGKIGL